MPTISIPMNDNGPDDPDDDPAEQGRYGERDMLPPPREDDYPLDDDRPAARQSDR